MVEVEFDLLDGLLWKIFEFLIFIAVIAVVCGNADDFVVNFAAVDEFHDAEDFGLHPNPGGERLVSNHENIEFVAVLIESLRNETIITGLGESDWLDTVKHEASVFAVPFDFMIAASRDFDDDVEFAFFVITRY